MQLTYRGQTYTSQTTSISTSAPAAKSLSCVLRYRGVAYTG